MELTGIINKPLLLHLVGCLCYLYQWRTVKQISDNEIYLLIKYIKSFLWRVAKCLSYREEVRCLKVNHLCVCTTALDSSWRDSLELLHIIFNDFSCVLIFEMWILTDIHFFFSSYHCCYKQDRQARSRHCR